MRVTKGWAFLSHRQKIEYELRKSKDSSLMTTMRESQTGVWWQIRLKLFKFEPNGERLWMVAVWDCNGERGKRKRRDTC